MISAIAHIKDGTLLISNRKRFAADIAKLKNGMVEITIKRANRRSNPQNRYLWGVVYKEIQIRLNELGNDFTPDDVHNFCKGEFLKVPVLGTGGEVIGYGPGYTSDLNKEDFGVYLDKVILWAAEFLEITIPLPGDNLQLFKI